MQSDRYKHLKIAAADLGRTADYLIVLDRSESSCKIEKNDQ